MVLLVTLRLAPRNGARKQQRAQPLHSKEGSITQDLPCAALRQCLQRMWQIALRAWHETEPFQCRVVVQTQHGRARREGSL